MTQCLRYDFLILEKRRCIASTQSPAPAALGICLAFECALKIYNDSVVRLQATATTQAGRKRAPRCHQQDLHGPWCACAEKVSSMLAHKPCQIVGSVCRVLVPSQLCEQEHHQPAYPDYRHLSGADSSFAVSGGRGDACHVSTSAQRASTACPTHLRPAHQALQPPALAQALQVAAAHGGARGQRRGQRRELLAWQQLSSFRASYILTTLHFSPLQKSFIFC